MSKHDHLIFKVLEKKTKSSFIFWIISLCLLVSFSGGPAFSQKLKENKQLDEKVKKFLRNHRKDWSDWNISETDGEVLFDLILKHNYTKALEIGTSTGRSAIWMAWALSKTGGKLITIEINKNRYKKALANFEEAGLFEYIDARLADAHKLVTELKGPFDFVFSDADKAWYKNYLIAVLPKMEIGGCFTAHNVLDMEYSSGIKEFLDYAKSVPNLETTIIDSIRAGISISYKIKED